MGKKNHGKIVDIQISDVRLEGLLTLPEGTTQLVIFVHGSGSSRHSPRNLFVATALNKAGIGTLLFDLLTKEEDRTYETRFDIPLLTQRLIDTTNWVLKQPELHHLKFGYFGASTGSASALEAAVKLNDPHIKAIVSRGGRPDLAIAILRNVHIPTLIIVGGDDSGVIELNEKAYQLIPCEKKLEIVPGATHLFEEPGTLEKVAELATQWFKQHL